MLKTYRELSMQKDSFINLLNINKMRSSQKPIIAEYTAPVQETLCTASSNKVI